MKGFKEHDGLNLPNIAEQVLEKWKNERTFEASISTREGKPSFVFYEGPPSANGMPGIHHVMGRTIKDLFCRYKTQRGFQVNRKAGWDTHGLPVELGVEKELGITKEDIGKKISIEEYNKACREAVMRYTDVWNDLTEKMGYWVDMSDPYVTYENKYIESVWWLLNQLYEKNMFYKGYTIQPYSPAAGTGLSSHELNLPGTYKDVKDTSATALFKVTSSKLQVVSDAAEKGNLFFMAWTTTPWTLPSNTALTVGSKIEYVLVNTFNPYTAEPQKVILAESLVSKYFKPEGLEAEMTYSHSDKLLPYRVLASFTGAELVGSRYEQLLPYTQPMRDADKAFQVIAGDFVTTEDGTGIVHTAPTFGADDMAVAKAAGVPPMLVENENGDPVPLVDLQGRFVMAVKDDVWGLAGEPVKAEYLSDAEREAAFEKQKVSLKEHIPNLSNYLSVDERIALKLKLEGKAFKVEKYQHNYPHCWRTDKPILYYPLDSWFIKASSAREKMIALNNTINWKPKSTGEGRFGKWLENLQDWNLSRSRYWGIPLPIWRTADGNSEICIGSIEELSVEIAKANAALGLNQSVPEDLHRPYIDDVTLVSDSGEPMTRELDLIDVWFDSGSMPYAQWHYPFENKEKFDRNFPADFIAEGVDQTRGWFYTLHAIGTMVFDSVAYKNVVSNGLVQDKHGRKMSKRLGNAINPFETLNQYGADATRWYMISNAQPWDNLKFDLDGVDETRRKFFGTLYNTYGFFALYANIDGFDYSQAPVPMEERPEIDRWVISLLNTLKEEVDACYADYDATNASRKIFEFVNDNLSNWYVRLCRRRFWKGELTQDKLAAYQTLYDCLVSVSKLMAPVAPFFADWLYRNLNETTNQEAHTSVHLTDFPAIDSSLIDKALEERMGYAQKISSLVLSLRKKEKIRVRQPLQKIMIPILDSYFQQQVEGVEDLIKSEVNIKEIEYLTDTSGVLKKKIKPNFKTLGRRLGKDMGLASKAIAQFDQDTINTIEQSGSYQLNLGDSSYDLTLDDFEITTDDIPGWLVANDGAITTALDITLTDELKAEGMARELVNRIQNIRKNSDFNVTDKIDVQLEAHEAIQAAVDLFGDLISNEVLANSIRAVEGLEAGESIELLDGVQLRILVQKI